MPRSLIFDKPPFVSFNVSGKMKIFSRQVIFPESFLLSFEAGIISKLGMRGKRKLYSVGKRFGYRFAIIGNFVSKGDVPDNELSEFIGVVLKFIEGTYASEIKGEYDVQKEFVKFYLDNFVIVRQTGRGYFLPLGGATGLIAKLFNNQRIEGSFLEKEGKYDVIYCSDSQNMPNVSEKFFQTNLSDLDVSPKYSSFNQIVDIKGAVSLKNLLDVKYFSYEDGILQHGLERFFLLEASGWYLLEVEFSKEKETKELLFSSAFNTGTVIMNNPTLQEVSGFISGTGWGIPTVLSKKDKLSVILEHVPWTKYCDQINFSILNGLLCGLLSSVYKRKVLFSSPIKDLNKGYLSLQFNEIY